MSKPNEVVVIPSSSEESSSRPIQSKPKNIQVKHSKIIKPNRKKVIKSYLDIIHLYGDGLLPY